MFRFLFCALIAAPALAQDLPDIPFQRLVLDPSHSTLTAQVGHLGIAPYTFGFDSISATLDIGTDELHATRLTAEIDVPSLDLPAPPDGFLAKLLGPDWLDAGTFPTISYASESIDRTGPITARMMGHLTMLGVRAPLVLHIRFHGGYASAAWEDSPRLGFTATGSFHRSDFGMTTGLPAPGSDFGVGDRIGFRVSAEFIRPAD